MKKKIKAEEYMNWDKNLAKELTPLEAYENLCSHLDYDSDDYMFNGNYEEDNEVVIKALTALEVIKKHSVNMDVWNCAYILKPERTGKTANIYLDGNLTDEEIDLLKEELL